MDTLFVGAAILLLASFTQTTTGFGFALVATPLLLFVLEPKSVVVLVVILAAINHAIRLFYFRRYVATRRVGLMCLGSIFGIPLGAYLLSSLNPSVLKLVVATLIIPSSILLLLGYSYHFRREILGHGVAGFISGVLATSTSLCGPPVVLFLLSENLGKERFNGTLAAYFLFVCLVSVGVFSFMGVVTIDVLWQVVVFLPIVMLGFYLGIRVLHRISDTLFKKMAASLVAVSALAIIVMATLELV